MRRRDAARPASSGCAVVISHDRWFLDRVATHVPAFEGTSEVAHIEDLERRKGPDADQPHRVAFRKLVRGPEPYGRR